MERNKEQEMIVFIDEETNTVMVCEDTVKKYNMTDINGISRAIKGKEVYYVTSADFVNGSDVVDLISNVTGVMESQSVPSPKNNTMYLHPVKMSDIIIHDDNGKTMILHGASDFKTVDSIPDEFMHCESIRQYIRAGLIEIVDNKRRLEVIAEVKQKRKRIDRLNSANPMLVPDYSQGSARDRAENGIKGEEDIASQMDISGDGKMSPDDQEMFRNIRELGIDIG